MDSLINTLVEPATLVGILAAVLLLATLLTIFGPMLQSSSLEVRLKSVASRREELRRKSREAMASNTNSSKESAIRRKDEVGLHKTVVERLQLTRILEDPKVVDRLAEAGYRGTRPVTTFYFFRFCLPFAFAALAAVYFLVLGPKLHMPGVTKFAIVMVAFAIGFYAPNIYVSNQANKRRTSIVGTFPDALDLLLICVESGMSIESALQKVSQEIGGASIELAEELQLLVAELSYLPDRRLAYEGFAKRVNNAGVKAVCTAMIQAERYGTPLGSALRIMAKENRELRLAAAEKKAASLPAKLTVPMIVFFLPVLFIVIMGPAAMRAMDAFK